MKAQTFRNKVGERTRSLDALGAQFEDLLSKMRTPAAKKGVAAAFRASPKKLGAAAVKAARK